PLEMGSTVPDALRRLGAHKEYPAAFRAVFGDGVSAANLARALASFERVLLAGDSRVDRFRAGKFGALSDSERQGLWLFESRCGRWACPSRTWPTSSPSSRRCRGRDFPGPKRQRGTSKPGAPARKKKILAGAPGFDAIAQPDGPARVALFPCWRCGLRWGLRL